MCGQGETAAKRLGLLLQAQPGAVGVRLTTANDWGSHTGFTYKLDFVAEGAVDSTDERIDLADGVALYVERKALWIGEGGLLGATLEIDEEFTLKVTPKE